MDSGVDKESTVKAAQCAALLVNDVRAIADSDNPFLAQLGHEALEAATALEQRLNRLKMLTHL